MLLTFLMSVLILYIPLPLEEMNCSWGYTLGGVSLLAGINVLVYWLGTTLAIKSRGNTDHTSLRATRAFSLMRLGVLCLVCLDVLAFEWPSFVQQSLGRYRWAIVVDDVVLLLPVLVMIGTAMAFRYRFEASRKHISLSLPRYLLLRFRIEIAVVLVGWLLLVFTSDLVEALFRHSAHWETADMVGSLGVLALIILGGPALLRFIWQTSPLPPGPLRTRLEALCKAYGLRFREILIWRTYNHLPNAAVVGLLPWVRYVLITDALLASCTPEEVEAIFAHEIAHVRHHHMAFYMLFAIAFLCFYANLIDVMAMMGWVETPRSVFAFEVTSGQAIVMLGFAIVYWVFVFGFISRRLEQQADLFSMLATGNPFAFTNALWKLSMFGHTSPEAGSWRHFSIRHRIAFLERALERPAEASKAILSATALQGLVLFLFVAGMMRLVIWRPELLGL